MTLLQVSSILLYLLMIYYMTLHITAIITDSNKSDLNLFPDIYEMLLFYPVNIILILTNLVLLINVGFIILFYFLLIYIAIYLTILIGLYKQWKIILFIFKIK